MKNNNEEIKVILSKVAWCGHCTNFLPVFNKSQKLTKNNKYLKNTNVNFEVYDMEEDLDKFKSNNYEDLLPQINGYPTVFVTSLKNGKRVNTEIIDHSNDPLEFINTVGETYNKLLSQSGGYKEEELYKQKYLKYKQKYTELKVQIGGGRFRVLVTKVGGTHKDPDPEKLYADIFIFDDDKSVPEKYKRYEDSSRKDYGSIGFIFIHPRSEEEQKIIMGWSNPYNYDKYGNDHGIIAYKNSIEKRVIEIAKDAYNRIKKEPNYKDINYIEYSYD
jgi:thiol-disulfide isomerase/thioredoxin